MKTARYLSTVFTLSFVAIFSTLSIISCTIIPPVPDVLYPEKPEDLQRVKSETLSVTGLVNLPSLGVSGSCVMMGHEGQDYYALTANHVVRHKPELTKVEITIFDTEGLELNTYECEVVAEDTVMDVALLKFTTEDILPITKLLEPHVTVGTHIYSVGCGNTDYPYIADGRVMAYQTFSSTYPTLYTCGPVVYGDSGGGVFSDTPSGYKLIGITVMLASYNDKSIWTIGLSVPSSHIAIWLRKSGHSSLVD